jgi:UPF0271 protein
VGALLNVDLGERDGEPEELWRLAGVVNVACGGHAGDEASIDRAIALALRGGARICAHPSFVDRAGFGRALLDVAPDVLAAQVEAQCRVVAARARRAGAQVWGVKPHGALYHAAARHPAIADAVVRGALAALEAPAWIGPPRGELAGRARAAGAPYLREGFADRGYRADGDLVPRGEPGALLIEPAAAAALALPLARAGACETICVHSDTDGAVEILRAVRAEPERAGLLEP